MQLTDIEFKALLSIGTIVSLLLVLWIINRYLTKVLKRSQFTRKRRKVAIRALRFIASLAAIVVLFAIWGVEHNSILWFASSLLTILGVAFFAQWSLLSNITAGLILYFNHPMKIGSYVKIEDKEFPIIGQVDDITLFFVKVKTVENQIITLPTNIVLQKAVQVDV
jgi:small-conductance mechanosensitive channel